MNALVSFDRVFEVLDLEPMIADADDARAGGRASPWSPSTTSRFTYPQAG